MNSSTFITGLAIPIEPLTIDPVSLRAASKGVVGT
jgi:hypothetical protein